MQVLKMSRYSWIQLATVPVKLLLLTGLFVSQSGFVLLSAKKATLPVSTVQPRLIFQWDGSSPDISNKDEFEGGIYAELDDQAFMQQLLNTAVNRWNEVRGSYLVLEVQLSASAVSMDPEDQIFSLVVEASDNASSAAYAAPQMDDEGTVINDCDINIASRKTEAKSLLRTIVHELGHCVGLGHPHSNYGAIMGYSRDDSKATLGADDIAGVIFLYPDPNYVSGSPKELIACGVLNGKNQNSQNKKGSGEIVMLLALILPLWQYRKKNGARGQT